METFVESMEKTNKLLETIIIQNKKLCALMSNQAQSLESVDESAIEIQTMMEKLTQQTNNPLFAQQQQQQNGLVVVGQEDSNSLVPHAPYPKEALNKI